MPSLLREVSINEPSTFCRVERLNFSCSNLIRDNRESSFAASDFSSLSTDLSYGAIDSLQAALSVFRWISSVSNAVLSVVVWVTLGRRFSHDGRLELRNADPLFAGEEMAFLLLEYKLNCTGEAEVEADLAAVMSETWLPQIAFFVSWHESGLFTYASRSNSILDGAMAESDRDLLFTFLAPNFLVTPLAPAPLAPNIGTVNLTSTPTFDQVLAHVTGSS